jgi:hypothetical protein
MKNLFAFTFALVAFFSFAQKAHAQNDENRTKLQLTITFGGKIIVSDINGVSTSLVRSTEDASVLKLSKDSLQRSMVYPDAFYLTVDIRKVSDELLTIFSKKQNLFDGTITIVDTYGKNPTRTIKFKKASLSGYSDQFSGGSYNEAYGSSSISIVSKDVSINGIAIEQ